MLNIDNIGIGHRKEKARGEHILAIFKTIAKEQKETNRQELIERVGTLQREYVEDNEMYISFEERLEKIKHSVKQKRKRQRCEHSYDFFTQLGITGLY